MAPDTLTKQERLTGNWNFAAVHSAANFSVKYLVATFSGRFEELDAKLEDGKLSGSVPIDSIVVKDENLAAHLKSPDFFDAESNPNITFESSKIELDGDKVELEGEITIKGTTK